MKKYLIYYFLFLSFSAFSFSPENHVTFENDSVKIERFKKHVNSLRYISRQTFNNEYFLNLSLKYIDSIKKYDNTNRFASEIEKSLLLTKNAISNDVISKIEFFDFYSGLPEYFGFIDPPIEYAFDDALSKLLESKYKFLGNAPLSEYRINSIIIKENCDEETFEIINQTLISNSKHFIISVDELNDIIGYEDAKELINGSLNENSINRLMKYLNFDRLGIFTVNNLDIIENKIWLANTDFKIFEKNEGLKASVFTRGFSVDKTNLPLILELLVVLFLAIIFVSFAYGLSLIFINRKNIFLSSKDSNIELLVSVVNKVKYVALYFFVPIILSFLMIYISSNIVPRADTDIGELSFKLWIVSLTILMSFLPIVINLFIVNRLNIDGFHTALGYTFFANSCLYATYFPIFIFYFIQYETYPFLINILLIFITLLIGNLLGKSYYQYGIKTKNTYKRSQAIIGLTLGLIALIIFNRIIIFELSIQNLFLSFIIIAPISIINNLLDNFLDKLFEKKSKNSVESTILNVPYIKSVMNPYDSIYKAVDKNMSNDLNIMLIDGPMGIGKTRSLKESFINFENNDWSVFYGDCDEIQDENAASFEPFLQAFSRLIGEDWNSRIESTDKITKGFINIASDKVGIPLEFSDFNNSSEKTMNEISLEIIDKLTKINKKTLFVMEDIHWVDPETLTLLRHFIKTVNRDAFLRKNLCIILTVRSELRGSFRGLSYEELKKELTNLNEETNNSFDLTDLLHSNSFNLVDFVKNLSIEKNKFKIASTSMNQINNLFNEYNEQLKSESKDDKLTPLYVFKVLESWISDENLKYTADGYILTKTVDLESLPNFEDVDSYYHKIFESFEPKWRRILESASVIGNKFDADILAQVWGYELLDVLDFLETAVSRGLLIDLSNQDNVYKFSDKRIVSALKSYFKDAKIQEQGEKQIVIEYNKRYLELQADIIKNPELFSTEEVLRVIRRMIPLSFSEHYTKKCNNLILDVVCRYLYSKKLGKLDAFANLLKKQGSNELARLLKKLRIIADDVNYSFEEKDKILKELYDDEDRKSKLPLPADVGTDQISDFLRLFIILSAQTSNSDEEYIITSSKIAATRPDFESFMPLIYKLPTILNGISLIYFIKNLGRQGSRSSEFSKAFSIEYVKNNPRVLNRRKQAEDAQKIMFETAVKQLEKTEFYDLARHEYELWSIVKEPDEIQYYKLEGKDAENKINEISKKYSNLIEKVDINNFILLNDCINSYLNFCHEFYKDGIKSNEVFLKYNEKLKIEEKINEYWILTYVKFILSSTEKNEKFYYNKPSNTIRPGKLFLEQNTKLAEKSFYESDLFLKKILDENKLTKASLLFIDAKKLFLLETKDYLKYKDLQLRYLKLIGQTFGEESSQFDRASVNIANDLESQSDRNLECPLFYDHCIKIWKKNIKYSPYNDGSRYQRLAELYMKKKSLQNSLKYTLKALNIFEKGYEARSPVGWDFVNGELIPISNDTKKLFYTFSGKTKMTIIGYGLCILNYARCLSMQKKYDKAIQMIDKACKYYHIFPKHFNLSQIEKGLNLVQIKSKLGLKLIKDSLKKLEKLDTKFNKYEIDLIKKAKNLINK